MEKHRYFIVYAIDLGEVKKISLAVSILVLYLRNLIWVGEFCCIYRRNVIIYQYRIPLYYGGRK